MIKSVCHVLPRCQSGPPAQGPHKIFAAFFAIAVLSLPVLTFAADANNPSAPLSTGGTTNTLIAAYDGGNITAHDLAEHQDEPFFVADAEQNAPVGHVAGADEKLARHLAAIRLLVGIASERGLTKQPDWALQTKLIEQRVLSQALHEDVRHQVFVPDNEVKDQWATNRYFLLGIDTIDARRIGISEAKYGDKTLERAKEALAQIRAGQDFGAVANKYSDLDLKTARKDTYLANFWGKQSGLAMAQLGEGKVSEPIPTKDGYELVLVEHFALHNNPTEEEARNSLRAKVGELAIAQHIAELAKAASDSFPLTKTLGPESRPSGAGTASSPQPSHTVEASQRREQSEGGLAAPKQSEGGLAAPKQSEGGSSIRPGPVRSPPV